MKPIVKTLLKRFLMTLGAITVWAKALAGGRGTDETDQKGAGGRQQKPDRETK